MRYHDIITEAKAKPKFLYHGTCKINLPAITATGIEPRVGAFVRQWYGKDKEGNARDLSPLVFAATKQHMSSCMLAMIAAISTTTGDHDLCKTADGFYSQAVLLVLPSDSFEPYIKGLSPPQVEKRDYYSAQPVKPVKIIRGEELRSLTGMDYVEARIGWYGE